MNKINTYTHINDIEHGKNTEKNIYKRYIELLKVKSIIMK